MSGRDRHEPVSRGAVDHDDGHDADDVHYEHHHTSPHHRCRSDAHRTGRQPVAAGRGCATRAPRHTRDG